MSRDVDEINPYAVTSEQVPEPASGLTSRHTWRGREMTVEASAMPKYAYQVTQYFLTLDGGQQFTSGKMTLFEDFDWQFEHEGRTVMGRFATKGLNNGFVQHYRIWIDGELITESKVRIKDGALGIGIGVVIGLAIFAGFILLIR